MSSVLFKNRAQLAAGMVSLIIGLGFLYLIIQTFITPQTHLQQAPPTPGDVPANVRSEADNAAQQIIALNILGTAQQATAARPAVVKPTRLQLKLLGVLNAAEESQSSIAIIADNSGTEMAIRVGEPIPGGASLEEVHPTHVILKHNGQLERLDLAQKEVSFDQPLPASPPIR